MIRNKNTQVLFIFEPNIKLRKYFEQKLNSFSSIKLLFPEPANEKTWLKHCANADIVVGWRPTMRLLQEAKQLSLYINPGAGVQHLVPLFKKLDNIRKVILVNGHGNSYFTAQHAVALLLALMNQVVHHHNWMRDGKWRTGDSEAKSIPLRDRKIGLLGYGNVNTKIHKFLSGFEIEFAVLRQHWKKQIEPAPTPIKKYTPAKLYNFLQYIDILIISIPQTTKSIGLIGKQELELLGKEALLVNIGRGNIIDEECLFNALKNKTIKGAAIDVWYNYFPEADLKEKKYPSQFPFHTLNNIILSPHRAASPFDDLRRWDEVIENIVRFSEGRNDFLNIVDLNEEY
ncbi:hypothetical protein JXI42_12290 [bacterium]|nr:hypothetical protein [bacterium]